MGAPVGNVNGMGNRKDRIISDAIRRELLANNGRALRALAKKVVQLAAVKGEVAAIKEVTDRMEGRAMQAVELSGPDGGAVEIRDAGHALGVARRMAFVMRLGQQAIEKAQSSAKEAESIKERAK